MSWAGLWRHVLDLVLLRMLPMEHRVVLTLLFVAWIFELLHDWTQ